MSAGTGGRTTTQGYSATDGVRQKFTQKERDNETGLDYFGARYYANTQGRFTSIDPLMASASTIDPQSLNRYSYVRNRPLGSIDPNGMDDCEIGKTCSYAENDWATNGNHPEQGQIQVSVTIVDTSDQTSLDAPIVVLGTTLEMRSVEPAIASAGPADWDPSCAACAGFLPEMQKRAVPIKQMVEVGAVIATAEIAASDSPNRSRRCWNSNTWNRSGEFGHRCHRKSGEYRRICWANGI
jgi:RHS repeat-associated protein